MRYFYLVLGPLALFLHCVFAEKPRPTAPPTNRQPQPVEVALPEEPGIEAWERAILAEVNSLRARGCRCPGGKNFKPAPALSWNAQLTTAAVAHAEDMRRNKFFDHNGSDGGDFADRITKAGYRWKTVAENIAQGYPNAKAVVLGWRNSGGHCENIMNAAFRDMGAARIGDIWVQTLAAQ